MSLILTAAPKAAPTGMADSAIVRPGGSPPIVSPHCRRCGVPVERFEIDPISSWYYLGVEVSCHGKTGGMKIPTEQAVKGGIVWFF